MNGSLFGWRDLFKCQEALAWFYATGGRADNFTALAGRVGTETPLDQRVRGYLQRLYYQNAQQNYGAQAIPQTAWDIGAEDPDEWKAVANSGMAEDFQPLPTRTKRVPRSSTPTGGLGQQQGAITPPSAMDMAGMIGPAADTAKVHELMQADDATGLFDFFAEHGAAGNRYFDISRELMSRPDLSADERMRLKAQARGLGLAYIDGRRQQRLNQVRDEMLAGIR